eukprot:GEMP01074027.1.p1 GENE.GEMP01074027.1~~GEMP01074027.1.p1  ORF type:complete len:266 (+),score=77.73 GEMP01074027.1:132-929(+)
MISNARRTFIRDGVQQRLRNDERQATDVRAIFVETRCLPNANGSSHLRLGLDTEVYVAVKLELEKTDVGHVEIFVEKWPELERLLAKWAVESLDMNTIRVDDNLHWRVTIDCSVIAAGGNVLDAASMAILAALDTTEVPRLRCLHSGEGVNDVQVEVIGGYDHFQWDWPLTLSAAGFPNDAVVIDPTSEEEHSASYTIAVAVNDAGVIGVQCPLTSAGRARVGDGPVAMDPGALLDVVSQCVAQCKQLRKSLKHHVAAPSCSDGK